MQKTFVVRESAESWFWSVCAMMIALTKAASAEVVINEIHYNGEPNTAANEFVELHNTATNAVEISGWYFSVGIGAVGQACGCGGDSYKSDGGITDQPANVTSKRFYLLVTPRFNQP